jgi:uncharacterized membrane protein
MPKHPVSDQHSPFVLADINRRREQRENRLADGITTFAGSMKFVYLHIAIFAVWMIVLEQNPWPTLTLAVSLEAIFLSTFVMIGQNRQSEFQQAKADHDFEVADQRIEAIHKLVKLLYAAHVGEDDAGDPPPKEPTAGN